MDNKQIRVPLKNGMDLVVDVYGAEPGCCNDEISVSIVDKDGCYMQDIALVRESLILPDVVEALVYADTYSEDYTHKFEIDIFKEDDNEKDI